MIEHEKGIEVAPLWALRLVAILFFPLAFIYDVGKAASEAAAEIYRRKGDKP